MRSLSLSFACSLSFLDFSFLFLKLLFSFLKFEDFSFLFLEQWIFCLISHFLFKKKRKFLVKKRKKTDLSQPSYYDDQSNLFFSFKRKKAFEIKERCQITQLSVNTRILKKNIVRHVYGGP